MSRSLLILQDSPDFGGHEVMFLRFLPALIDSGTFDRIVVRHPASNQTFAQRLDAYASPKLEVGTWGFSKGRGEPYLAGLRHDYARAVRGLFAELRPAATLLLQGRIENCAVPLLAAPVDSHIVSYVPMAHRMADLGRNAMIGDWVRRRLYQRPDRFIVPGKAIVGQIRAAGGKAPVAVVDNVVTPPPAPTRDEARAQLELPRHGRIALFLGRLETRQKGLDLLAGAIRRGAARLGDWTFLFVGSGPGEGLCADLARAMDGRVRVQCIPWSNTPHALIAAADVMLMPSRWEGVPLVMLEAMTYGVPILASHIDVFEDYLPAANRIDFASAALAEALERVTGARVIEDYRAAAVARLGRAGLARSSARFVQALSPERQAA